jgi:tetratricopeptide (TPR) repeat protein
MIPRQSMQTTKKQAAKSLSDDLDIGCGAQFCDPQPDRAIPGFRLTLACSTLRCTLRFIAPPSVFSLLLAVTILTGCSPPGPQAVLDGKKLLERGDYVQAIEELRTATQFLPTNALAFSYLGLAFHQAGQPAEAERAYLRALALDHDLTEVHYNLGCLLLSQSNKLDQAKAELTTYTLRRPNSSQGWLKLGETQLRSRELTAAEKSLNEALKLDPQDPEVLTTLGLARYQRKRANEAAQYFNKALKEQPNYGPALLNLAIVAQQELNNPQLALQKYQEYLSLKPAPANAQAVNAIVRQLEQELNPPPREPATNLAVVARTNALKAPAPELAHAPGIPKPPATNASHAPVASKTDLATNVPKSTSPTNLQKSVPVTNTAPAENVELVKLGSEPVIKPAEDLASAPAQTRPPEVQAATEGQSASAPTEAKSQKRGFFQRINPINLFARDGKSPSNPAPTMASAATEPTDQTQTTAAGPVSVPDVDPRKFPRYAYRTPEKPTSGDRGLAEMAFSQGVREQQAQHLPQAIQAYRRAAQLDPGFYDAHYNLGLAAAQNGNLPLALAAYETALAIEPESLDARYNFGLVLKQAGYVLDAVAEFEKILAKYPNEGRTHLALGNLYAQQLQEPAKARQHYMAVLAVAPQSPQAGAIRYWLTDHPR